MPKGKDFWSQVEQWFIAHHEILGRSWSTVGWTEYVICFIIPSRVTHNLLSYISITIAEDIKRYQPAPFLNPYIMEAEEAGQAAAAAPSTSGTRISTTTGFGNILGTLTF